MSTASSTANAQRPRILLQFNQHKEGSVPTIRTVQDGPTSEEEYEEDDEEEDEVDQLVSTEDEATGQAKVPMSASAAGASKPRVRSQKVSVQPPIPLSRLEGLLDSEISEAMSKEALFVLSAATDAFIKRLADTGYKKSSHMKRATVTYHDLGEHWPFVPILWNVIAPQLVWLGGYAH
ncbi:hypothetical protein BDY19DRAFT_349582 [Irpex rosettiformis]|uniref:Uncharacterized protein n=1 Tax=Irpex rosettiformis TaxID=378272 RepID=A0ACB8TWZ7_9APHY|nr:hypothetical protein BDY19DRAFT_349582 [Irpex rosettiformis]